MEEPSSIAINPPSKRLAPELRATLRTILSRLGLIARHRFTTLAVITMVVICGLAPRVAGLPGSLWLDEAWVANSVMAPSVLGVFYYETHLQVSPPVFLLMVRFAVGLLGLSNEVLRLTPFLMGILAAVAMAFALRRLLSRNFALFAWTLFFLSPVAIEFSSRVKPFTSELAAATLLLLVVTIYLESPSIKRFWLLVGTTVFTLLLAYPIAFVIPGIVILLMLVPSSDRNGRSDHRSSLRALALALVASATLAFEYYLLIKPNSSSALEAFWWGNHNSRGFLQEVLIDGYTYLSLIPFPERFIQRNIVGDSFFVIALLGCSVLAYLRFRNGNRRWLQLLVLCAVPAVSMLFADWFGLYPLSRRTSLFLLPFLVASVGYSLQTIANLLSRIWEPRWFKPLLRTTLVLLTLGTVALSTLKSLVANSHLPHEDVSSAVSFLRQHVQAGDFLWIHPSCAESFKLYQKMIGWYDAPARYGNTGWPCCPRGHSGFRGASTEQAVRADLNAGIPVDFTGTVWVLSTSRNGHWSFVGLEEPKVTRAVLRERGCTENPIPYFLGININSFSCPGTQAGRGSFTSQTSE